MAPGELLVQVIVNCLTFVEQIDIVSRSFQKKRNLPNLRKLSTVRILCGEFQTSGYSYLPGIDNFSIRKPRSVSLSAGIATVKVRASSVICPPADPVLGLQECLWIKLWTTSLSKIQWYQWGWPRSSFNLTGIEYQVINPTRNSPHDVCSRI